MFDFIYHVIKLQNIIPYLLSLPLFTSLFIYALSKSRFHYNVYLRDSMIVMSGVLLFLGVLFQYLVIKEIRNSGIDATISYALFTFPAQWHSYLPFFNVAFKIGAMGILFALVLSLLWPVTVLYSIGFMKANKEKKQTTFYIFSTLGIFSALGIAFSANLWTLFCFDILLSVTTFPLVMHKKSPRAKSAGKMYLKILIGTAIFLMLPAIIWTYNLAGSTDFINEGILKGKISNWSLSLLLGLFVFGTAKAALMPCHKWLLLAMISPMPTSALFHAVIIITAGVFTLLKITLYIFGLDFLKAQIDYSMWFLYIATFTLIASGLLATLQDKIIKRLAYSTISQFAVISISASLFTPLASIGGMIHIAVNAFANITLFFAAGCIYIATRKTKISQLDGLARKMPVTFICFTVGCASLIGFPLTAGFISKWYLIQGSWNALSITALSALIITTLLNVYYLLPIIYRGFLGSPKYPLILYQRSPALMLIAMVFTTLFTIAIFISPNWLIKLSAQLIGTGI